MCSDINQAHVITFNLAYPKSKLVQRCRCYGCTRFKYGGLCCESCKLFFLRNASKDKLNCLKSGNCEIDIFSRKNCAKCRLDNCFANGMMLKSIQNFKKNQSNSILDLHMRNILQNIDFPKPQKLNLPEFPYIKTRKRQYACELIAPERQMIANVQNVLCETFVNESNLRVIGSVSKWIDILTYTALYSQRIVRFCKSVPEFVQLCPNDQLIILKPFCFEILNTRLAYLFDRAKKGYPIIENEISNQTLFVGIELCLQIKNQPLIQELVKFLFDLCDELEDDFSIRDLLVVILMFKPRANLSNQEFVHYQYSLYCRLLRRYLQHKYKNVYKADKKYQTLIQITDGFDEQAQKSRFLVESEFDLRQIPQIVLESLDL